MPVPAEAAAAKANEAATRPAAVSVFFILISPNGINNVIIFYHKQHAGKCFSGTKFNVRICPFLVWASTYSGQTVETNQISKEDLLWNTRITTKF